MKLSSPGCARALVIAACLALAGCASALEFARGDPPRLYELTPKSTFADALPEVDARLSVEVPTATAGLNNSRIALRPTATTLEYYARASWIDVVPVMVQNLLLESLDNTGRIDVIGREVVGVRADYALLTHVREFQAEYDDQDAPQVRVRLQARLVRLPRRTSLAATSEEFVVRASATSLSAIVTAFDEAFGKALKRIVEWTVIQAALAQDGPGQTQPI
ncbi:MAG TPA: ABC-type transport auxiliary lipoprotein family protein [Geminicoccaceae bacterium]|nr:ABC-type transport auxiliary lipoprotein family protein [Geminicoccaceae bacterium]